MLGSNREQPRHFVPQDLHRDPAAVASQGLRLGDIDAGLISTNYRLAATAGNKVGGSAAANRKLLYNQFEPLAMYAPQRLARCSSNIATIVMTSSAVELGLDVNVPLP